MYQFMWQISWYIVYFWDPPHKGRKEEQKVFVESDFIMMLSTK